MKKFLYKGLSMCMAISILFSVPVTADTANPGKNQNIEKDYGSTEEELKETTVYMVGDSTMCEYGYDENYAIPRAGWGMYLSEFLSDKAKIVNLALGGRSSKSFTTEENYKKMLENIKEGDFLIIQFGHNDEKDKSEEDLKTRYTDPKGDKDTEGSFKNSLYTNYILPAREKGATPILISPVSRRKFDETGKVTDSHGLYDDAVRELAKETDVYFVDMTNITADAYYYLFTNYWAEPIHAVYKDPSKGIDNTHFSHLGASCIAYLFLEAAKENKNPLSKYALSDDDIEKKANKLFSNISRGKFIALLMRAVGIEGEAKDNFTDVDKNADYANAVGLAKEAGIAVGDETGKFNPETPLKLYEMTSFIMRTLKHLNFEYEHADPSQFDNIGNWTENYDSYPKYSIQDMADWFTLEDTDVHWYYHDIENLDNYFVQAELIRLCELLGKDSEKEEQSLEDLEKVENTK